MPSLPNFKSLANFFSNVLIHCTKIRYLKKKDLTENSYYKLAPTKLKTSQSIDSEVFCGEEGIRTRDKL